MNQIDITTEHLLDQARHLATLHHSKISNYAARTMRQTAAVLLEKLMTRGEEKTEPPSTE